jgi:hypothetical protein
LEGQLPKSRSRPKDRRGRSHRGRFNALDFDRILEGPFHQSPTPGESPPHILYHYTNWAGAYGILSSQCLWATAHDCTNDEAELASADGAILNAVKELRRSCGQYLAEVVDRFLAMYAETHISKSASTYLTCFSSARDDPNQWKRYGDEGRGVCLGFRLLKEQARRYRDWTSRLMQVDYSESSWRTKLKRDMESIQSTVSSPNILITDRNINMGVSVMHNIASAYSISSKYADWAVEKEFRKVTLIRKGKRPLAKERVNASGTTVRYLEIPVRKQGLISFAENPHRIKSGSWPCDRTNDAILGNCRIPRRQ